MQLHCIMAIYPDHAHVEEAVEHKPERPLMLKWSTWRIVLLVIGIAILTFAILYILSPEVGTITSPVIIHNI